MEEKIIRGGKIICFLDNLDSERNRSEGKSIKPKKKNGLQTTGDEEREGRKEGREEE